MGNNWKDNDGTFNIDWLSYLGWGTYNPYKGNDIFFTCGTEKIIGGRGVFGARSAITKSFKLPPHHTA